LPPRKSSEPIVDKNRWKLIFFYAAVIAFASTLAVLINHFGYHSGQPWDAAMCNNILFFTIIFCQLFHVFNMGTGPFFKTEVIRNKYVWVAVVGSIVILLSVIQIPSVRQALNIIDMTLREWILILSAAVFSVIIIQTVKSLNLFRNKGQEHLVSDQSTPV
ncbi:MAG: cation transporting ATPase C-terminal domain-containing protein, partial [Chitinophagaceae bacterium]